MRRTRSVLLALVIALVLALLAYALFHLLGPAADPPAVLLPPPPDPQAEEDDLFSPGSVTLALVDRNTVLDILAALKKPDSYSRSLAVSTFWEGGGAMETIHVWAMGSSLRIVSGEKNILLLEDMRYLWYADEDKKLLRSPEEAALQGERYQRLISYESLLETAPEVISAGYLKLGEEDCIYLEYTDGAFGYVNKLFISASTGLLLSGETWDGESCVYRMSSGPVDISTPEEGVFALPG